MTPREANFKVRAVVGRASEWDDEVCPVDGATIQTVGYWQRRTLTEHEFDRSFAEREGVPVPDAAGIARLAKEITNG